VSGGKSVGKSVVFSVGGYVDFSTVVVSAGNSMYTNSLCECKSIPAIFQITLRKKGSIYEEFRCKSL